MESLGSKILRSSNRTGGNQNGRGEGKKSVRLTSKRVEDIQNSFYQNLSS